MRKYVALAIAGVVAILTVSFAFAAPGDQQTIKAKLTPTKLDKKKYKPAKIAIKIDTKVNDQNPSSNEPPKATNTKVDFPTNMKFDTKAVKNCKVSSSSLEGTTSEQAIKACGKKSKVSVDGKGTRGEVQIGTPDGPAPLPVVINAFNGKEKNTLYLHAYQGDTQNTSILVGKLKKGPKGYGKRLDVNVPPLIAGAISKFYTVVKAGKYVQARCKSKTNKFQATTKYLNHSTTKATTTTKCKRKKK